MKLLANTFIVQQQLAIDEHHELINKLLATGRCYPAIPPDCFVWKGTKKQFLDFMSKQKRKK